MWFYFSGIPIAAASAMTARELLRCDDLQVLQARRIAILVVSGHALLYALRALVLPWFAARFGLPILLGASQITMYEGVLYSVVLPMVLLRLVREETHGRLSLESQTDYLTGLGNRRWFFEQGERLIRNGAPGAARRPMTVLAFDLDQFKAINDRFGHKAGDEVLKAFAAIARALCGPEVLLARLGGEEFAALLVGQDAARARSLGEAVVRRFAETIADRVDGTAIHATVSIGLAHFDHDMPPLAMALAAADGALYLAKACGGNRLELAGLAAEAAHA